jgi:hypothetical protein
MFSFYFGCRRWINFLFKSVNILLFPKATTLYRERVGKNIILKKFYNEVSKISRIFCSFFCCFFLCSSVKFWNIGNFNLFSLYLLRLTSVSNWQKPTSNYHNCFKFNLSNNVHNKFIIKGAELLRDFVLYITR